MNYPMNILEKIEQIERLVSFKFFNKIPLQATIRMFMGIIFLWFGALKFDFIPGDSPAVGLIKNVWGPYLNAELFIIFLAVFETAVGICLLFNVKVRLVSFILMGHMAGTFTTIILDPGAAFNLKSGGFSLTLEGQYIFKNLLIITNCLMLALATTRKSPRKFHRTMGRMHFEGENHEMVTNDLSLTGISFFPCVCLIPKTM